MSDETHEPEVTYRGVKVPAFLFAVSVSEEYTAWSLGVDQGVELALGVPPIRETSPAYRYFHDGDPAGHRWFARIKAGEDRTTGEVFRDYGAYESWKPNNSVSPYSLEDLDDLGWTEVQYDELPPAAQDHKRYL